MPGDNGCSGQQFCEYLLANIQSDAVMDVCDDNQMYVHLEKDGNMFSVDDFICRACREMSNRWIQTSLFR